jgi:hypothetical protein
MAKRARTSRASGSSRPGEAARTGGGSRGNGSTGAGSSGDGSPEGARGDRHGSADQITREDDGAGRSASQVAESALVGEGPGISEVVQESPRGPDGEPTGVARDQHVGDAEAMLALSLRILRQFMEACDEDEMPFIRVVGRVAHILTGEGGRETFTCAPIAVAFQLFLRQHLEDRHRQSIANRQAIDVTETNLQGLLYDRLKKLCSRPWGAVEKATGAHGYRLTEDGRFVFNGWPEGIEFDASNQDLWVRKQVNRG